MTSTPYKPPIEELQRRVDVAAASFGNRLFSYPAPSEENDALRIALAHAHEDLRRAKVDAAHPRLQPAHELAADLKAEWSRNGGETNFGCVVVEKTRADIREKIGRLPVERGAVQVADIEQLLEGLA